MDIIVLKLAYLEVNQFYDHKLGFKALLLCCLKTKLQLP